jgi:cbb3-type cytochrome oxidase subunit 3
MKDDTTFVSVVLCVDIFFLAWIVWAYGHGKGAW